MRGKARHLQSEHGLDLLIIDYLQLIAGGGRIDNRVQEMGEISRSIKGMARDFDIPCGRLLAAQPRDRAATKPSPAAVRPSRERQHRAGRGCGGVHSS